MKTALLTALVLGSAAGPAFADLHCSTGGRANVAHLQVSGHDGTISGTYVTGEQTLKFQGTEHQVPGTYNLVGGGLTSLEVIETAIPAPEPRPCPRCASAVIFKTTAVLQGPTIAPVEFPYCTGALE